ncbi:uncharacterized protein LOC133296592 [Gastrolobium bilobum]|uniref:uncharacterized protein LOC133296592 n=1 Tax=Gastrolobium bilobum TaxID=150636 RepID=UPI002AB0BABA|nr:uncharacterized protein LOC133296592 [Gastrolobium bilobum]
MAPNPITREELHLFHQIDREVLCLLIFKLHRELSESLLVMALWLWLESIGYPNIIRRIMSLPNNVADALVNEAAVCLHCLETNDDPVIPNGGGLPVTQRVMERDVSLQVFNEKRYTAIAGIKSVLKNIFSRIFTDVVEIILKSTKINKASTSRASTSNKRLIVPGFPHPLFGNFDLQPIENVDLFDERIWDGKLPFDDVADDDKSMFLTFSRGFPVSENEVRQLFTRAYGDCVLSLTMGTVDENDQPLFAKLVLKTVETVDQVLNGKRVAKLKINGKHIWARKFHP